MVCGECSVVIAVLSSDEPGRMVFKKEAKK
jgi:hypothetical protein